MIKAVNSIKQPVKEKKLIFQLAKELGLTFKPTNCGKCLKDYISILKEELGTIENAAEESGFDENEPEYVWKYIYKFPVNCGGVVYNQDTDPKYIEKFAKENPNKFYVKEYIHKEEELPQQEETINNEE